MRDIARDNIKIDDKQLSKKLAQKLLNPFHFPDRALQVGFNFILESHNFNLAIFKVTIEPNYPDFGIDLQYINKNLEEIATINAKLFSQKKILSIR